MDKPNSHPPKPLLRFLRWFCHPELLKYVEGDLIELYHRNEKTRGKKLASWLFAWDVIKLLRPSLIKDLGGIKRLNYYGMFKIYSKSTFRLLVKNRLISITSLLSLIVGVLCFHLIYLWIDNETSMDSFHKNRDRIYVSGLTANPMSDYQTSAFSLFFNLDYSQFAHVKSKLTIHTYNEDRIKLIAADGQDFPGRGLIVDSTFFKFFNFPIVAAQSDHLLKDPKNIVISKGFAKRIFGDEDPIGKVLKVQCEIIDSYTVSGLLEEIPSNSSLTFDFLVPRHSQSYWARSPQELFITDSSFDLSDFNQKIAKMGRGHSQFKESTLSAIPFKSIYFEKPFQDSLFSKNGDLGSVKTMAIIAIFILMISTLTFASLQTSLQLSTIKGMGIKQVNGARKMDLVIEMMIGRIYFLALTIIGTYALLELTFPYYSGMLEITIDRNRQLDFVAISTISGIIMFVSIFLSIAQIMRIRISTALKNTFASFQIAKVQRGITTLQFVVTITLLISTMVVFRQFHFMTSKDIGFEPASIISFQSALQEIPRNLSKEEQIEQHELQKTEYQYFVNELASNPNILSVTQGEMPVNDMAYAMPWKSLVGGDYTSENMMVVDPSYADLLNLEVLEGRFFSDSLDKSRQQKIVINEAAKAYWGIEDISEMKLANNYWGGEEDPYTIIGVVKNYHYEHLSNKIKPLMLVYFRDSESDFMVKIQNGKELETIAYIEGVFRETNPTSRFDYEFLEDKVQSQYEQEKRVSNVYLVFTIIALMLSSIGLFTFAIYDTKRRTKEVGIRKINGASLENIFSILSTSYLKPVALSYVIACPLAWYLAQNWLENFANRIHLGLPIFLLAGVLSILIALGAVAWQSWDSAKKNPIDALRYE